MWLLVKSARIVPGDGNFLSVGCDNCHRFERRTAREHWKKTLLTWTISTVFGALPSTLWRCNNSGSTEIPASPITRNVSPNPGTKNNNAICGLWMILRKLSIRLFPRLSGITSVFSLSISTNPDVSPLGDASKPLGPMLANTKNGDALIIS